MKLGKVKPVTPQRTASVKPAASAPKSQSNSTDGIGCVALKLTAPKAKHVYVAGSFNNWHASALPLKPAGKEWIGEVKLAPGRYEYLFVVDGQWLPDPNARETIPNPFGGFNSLLSVS